MLNTTVNIKSNPDKKAIFKVEFGDINGEFKETSWNLFYLHLIPNDLYEI